MKKLIILLAGVMTPAFPAFAEISNIHDGQIANFVVTASGIALETGWLAQSKSSSEEIKAYAQRVVLEQTEFSQSAIELARKRMMGLQDNPISQSLRSDGGADLARLQTLSGPEFDKAYLDQKIIHYQNMLDTIENQLMPHASDEELKILLSKLFAPLSLHLEEALQIRESLGKPDQTSQSDDESIPDEVLAKSSDDESIPELTSRSDDESIPYEVLAKSSDDESIPDEVLAKSMQ